MSLSKIALTLQGASFDQNKILRGRYHYTHIETEIEDHPAATLRRVNIQTALTDRRPFQHVGLGHQIKLNSEPQMRHTIRKAWISQNDPVVYIKDQRGHKLLEKHGAW